MRTRRRAASRRGVVLLLPLLAATLGALLAHPGCGGSSPTSPPASAPATTVPPATLPPAPTKLSDLSASVTSPQSEASINCSDDLAARVTLVNNGGTDVAVRGVLMRAGTVAGNCGGDFEWTYRPRTSVAPAHTTTVVLDGLLFADGPACCDGKGCGGSCRLQSGFEVQTDIGSVPAGAFGYKVFFQNCRSCTSGVRADAASAAAPACARMRAGAARRR